MQTFLPFEDFAESAASLDLRRLGKQIIESRQIGLALTRKNYGWKNHPAVRMWRGYESALLLYAKAMSDEWHSRRGKLHGAFVNMAFDPIAGCSLHGELPPWLGDEALHLSHRSNLLRKDPDHYRPLFEDGLVDDLPYVWPIGRDYLHSWTITDVI